MKKRVGTNQQTTNRLFTVAKAGRVYSPTGGGGGTAEAAFRQPEHIFSAPAALLQGIRTNHQHLTGIVQPTLNTMFRAKQPQRLIRLSGLPDE